MVVSSRAYTVERALSSSAGAEGLEPRRRRGRQADIGVAVFAGGPGEIVLVLMKGRVGDQIQNGVIKVPGRDRLARKFGHAASRATVTRRFRNGP